MKVPCNVIRDLLPLYHDNVCSPETATLVEEHLKDCDACQEEFHKLQANLLPLPLPVPGKEEQKAEGLAKVKKVLRKKRVIVAAIVAAVTIVLCYGGYLFLHLPIMGGPIESVHSVSVEEETGRLVVGLQPDYGGLGRLTPCRRRGLGNRRHHCGSELYLLPGGPPHPLSPRGPFSWKEVAGL